MRRRFRYDRDLEKVVEIFDHNGGPTSDGGPFVLRDISEHYKEGGFASGVDGEWITSRSQLRAHERKHGVKQAGDFKPGELIAREKARTAPTKAPQPGVEFKWI